MGDVGGTSAVIETDVPCVRCGYLLRGLSVEGQCPECGAEVGPSVHGGYLLHADPLWVVRLGQAAMVGIVFNVAMVGSVAMAWLGYLAAWDGGGGDNLYWWMSRFGTRLMGLVPLIGWLSAWLLATPDSQERPDQPAALIRKWLRVTAATAMVLRLPEMEEMLRLMYLGRFATLPGLVAGIAGTVLFYLLLRHVATLVPDVFVIRHAPIVMVAVLISEVLNGVVPWLVGQMGIGSNSMKHMSPAVMILSVVIACAYDFAIMLRCRRVFVAAAIAARDNWGKRGTRETPVLP